MFKFSLMVSALLLTSASAQADYLICKGPVDKFDHYHLVVAETLPQRVLAKFRVYHAFASDVRKKPNEYGFMFAMEKVTPQPTRSAFQAYELASLADGGDQGDGEPVELTGIFVIPLNSLNGERLKFPGRLASSELRFDERLNCEIKMWITDYVDVAFPSKRFY